MSDNRYKKYFDNMLIQESKSLDINISPFNLVYARLDGRSFHSFTRHCTRPFDLNLMEAMKLTTKEIADKFNANYAYTQSDEISLIWLPLKNINSQFIFNGKQKKLLSILASETSVIFNSFYKHPKNELATFDCRIMNYDTLSDNQMEPIIIRQIDCRRNSVQMFAQSKFSHKELQNKSIKEQLKMIYNMGIVWSDVNESFRNGSLFTRTQEKINTTAEYFIEKNIPEKYRKDEIIRTIYEESHNNMVSLI